MRLRKYYFIDTSSNNVRIQNFYNILVLMIMFYFELFSILYRLLDKPFLYYVCIRLYRKKVGFIRFIPYEYLLMDVYFDDISNETPIINNVYRKLYFSVLFIQTWDIIEGNSTEFCLLAKMRKTDNKIELDKI